MGLNKPFDRHFFVMNGAVKTTGGDLNLAKGQLSIVDISKTTPEGVKAVSTFAGTSTILKNFEIRLGVTDKEPNRSYSNKPMSSMAFSLGEVKKLSVSTPKITEQVVDDVIIGYDGITAGSSFNFQTGDSHFTLALELTGDYISYMGGGTDREVVVARVEIPQCDPFNTCVDCDDCAAVDCKKITLDLIDQLRRRQIAGGKTVDEVVEITPVFSCDNDVTATTTGYTYYTLQVCDTGSDGALALVQVQYPTYKVTRTDRVGSTSTYQVLIPTTDGQPDDYEAGIPSIIKDCEDCPSGYTEVAGGYVYALTLEDEGAVTTAFNTLPGFVSGTLVKSGNDHGVGFYTAVFTAKLTDTQIATFIAAANVNKTATFHLMGDVPSICTNDATTSYSWAEGETCSAVTQTYRITLPDTKCGEDRLTELQGAYPNNTITIANDQSSQKITLTGTSGTANINFKGTNYLATFATSLTVTAANFVTANAAAILTATGVTVTSSGPDLTFKGPNAAFTPAPTVTNVTTNLAGTVAALSPVPLQGGCQTVYQTTVITNMVCEECDPIYNDYYTSEAPASYATWDWTLVPDTTTSPSGNCMCGIRFRGKTFTIDSEEALRDWTGFTETSTQIRVSAGFPEEIREGIGRLPQGAIEGKYLSTYQPRTHLGGEFLQYERESRSYFLGVSGNDEYLTRVLRGTRSNIENLTDQYVVYTVLISNFKHTQNFAGRINEDINYNIYVQVGQHTAVENLLNSMAAAAGVETVKAFPA